MNQTRSPKFLRRLPRACGLLVAAVLTGVCRERDADPMAAWLAAELAPPAAEFYFTDPDPAADRRRRRAALDRSVELIDAARNRLDLFVYGFNQHDLIDALARARSRGVTIRISGSPDQNYANLEARGFFPDIRAGSALAHAKVILADDATLLAGTGNFTRSDYLHSHNVYFVLPLRPGEAARLRAALTDDDAETARSALRAGPARAWVAPANGRLIQQRLVSGILSARTSLRYLIFSFSDPILSDALHLQARRGVLVEGVYDDEGDDAQLPPDSEALRLNSALGLAPARLYLEGNRNVFYEYGIEHGGHLHHKTLIVDDTRTLTGSYNWSYNARDANREIYFEFDDPAVAALFRAEFERIRSKAALLPRAPLDCCAGELQPGGLVRAGALHTPAGHPAERLTLFAGVGPWLRAFHFDRRLNSTELTLSRARRFAGGAAAGEYALAPQTDDFALAVDRGAGRFVLPGPEGLPCESAGACRAANAKRISLKDGWIWFTQPSAPARLRMFRRNGWHAAEATQAGAPEVLHFASPGDGDALVFLERPGVAVEALCAQSGADLDAALETLRAAIAADMDQNLPCLVNE